MQGHVHVGFLDDPPDHNPKRRVREGSSNVALEKQGSKTFVSAPHPCGNPKTAKTSKIQLQNYGAKDMVHKYTLFLVFAP
jgi:hypothetical protein